MQRNADRSIRSSGPYQSRILRRRRCLRHRISALVIAQPGTIGVPLRKLKQYHENNYAASTLNEDERMIAQARSLVVWVYGRFDSPSLSSGVFFAMKLHVFAADRFFFFVLSFGENWKRPPAPNHPCVPWELRTQVCAQRWHLELRWFWWGLRFYLWF